MRIAALIVVALAACGKREPAPASAPAPVPVIDAVPPPITDAAPLPPDAPEAAFAHDPSADLRALGAALEGVDFEPIKAWIERAQAPHPDDQPFDEPVPDDAQKIGALLIEWDRSGAVAHLDCEPPTTMAALLFATGAALEGATRADDPIVHAILRFSHALESRDSGPMGIAFGIDLATRVAEWRHRRRLPETDDMRTLAPTDDLARRAAQAEVRCGQQALVELRARLVADPTARDMVAGARREDGLDTDGDVIAIDTDAAAAYLAETGAVIDRTPSDSALADALDRRAERAVKDSRSEAARLVAVPHAFHQAQTALSQYRAAAAGREWHAP